MFKFGVITASDKGFRGEREDISGKVIINLLEQMGFTLKKYIVLPDEQKIIIDTLRGMSDVDKIDLILTTGGTGFAPRDVTPEATKAVIDREVPGIVEAIRAYSLTITKRAMLSRAVSGIRNRTLIINLPGSPKAVKESLEYIGESLKHGLEILNEQTGECARV